MFFDRVAGAEVLILEDEYEKYVEMDDTCGDRWRHLHW
jgi:hypothetical protein